VENKTILVVDDDRYITHILNFKLQQTGAAILIARHGEEGYELACQHKPDLVITDFQMPVMNGFDMCVKLRTNQATAGIPVIMLTARGHKLSPSQLAQTTIHHLIAKPFSAHELLEKVAEVFGQNGATGDRLHASDEEEATAA